jgi:hypothetical protein
MLMLSDRSCENSRLQSAKTRGWVVRLALARGDGEFEVRCHHGASQSRLHAGSGRIEVGV